MSMLIRTICLKRVEVDDWQEKMSHRGRLSLPKGKEKARMVREDETQRKIISA